MARRERVPVLGAAYEAKRETLVPSGGVHKMDRPDRGENLRACQTVKSRSIEGIDRSLLGNWDRVLVTGGTGCVGTAVLKLLRSMGVSQLVSVADRPPAARRTVPGVEYVRCDVTDLVGIEQTLLRTRPDLVVHLAAVRDPGLAERRVIDAVTTNVVGTEVVMHGCQTAGVPVVVAASTGKAMRMFTSDVYASTKQLVEYQVSRAARASGMRTGCARFTHIVDNSLIWAKLVRWAKSGAPIALHGPDPNLYVQSAREAAELLILTAKIAADNPDPGWITAITNLGWPPVNLFGLAMDVVEDTGSQSPIVSVGFPPGYEERAYPGTTDPLTAGDHTPLFSAIEVAQSVSPTGSIDAIDVVSMLPTKRSVDADLRSLELSLISRSPDVVRAQLRATSQTYLRHKLACAPTDALASMARRGSRHELTSADHHVAHKVILEASLRTCPPLGAEDASGITRSLARPARSAPTGVGPLVLR